MRLKDFIKEIENQDIKKEIRMSCMGYKDTQKYPEDSLPITMGLYDEGLEVEVEWDYKSKTTLEDFWDLINNNGVVEDSVMMYSVDVDDGNIIYFKRVVISQNYIILV